MIEKRYSSMHQLDEPPNEPLYCKHCGKDASTYDFSSDIALCYECQSRYERCHDCGTLTEFRQLTRLEDGTYYCISCTSEQAIALKFKNNEGA